jgi:16S rRNA (uracil1498-N3)-methyltransferase
VHLLAGITANERMDWLVEKATELGAASITPLLAERSVLKLKGERADKKRAHWQAIAIAACEQCGRNRVPVVAAAVDLAGWLEANAKARRCSACCCRCAAAACRSATSRELLLRRFFSQARKGASAPPKKTRRWRRAFRPVTLGAARAARRDGAPGGARRPHAGLTFIALWAWA